MEASVLQLTREDLQKHTEEIVVNLNQGFDKKLDEKIKGFDDKFEQFRKDFLPKEKQDPDYIMGKTVYDLIRGKLAAPQLSGVDADGGHLVPDVTRAEILRLLENFGDGRRYMRTIPMGKADTLRIPRKLTGLTVSRVGENVAIPDTKATLGTVTLTASKAALIVAMSSELEEDSIVDFGAYLNELIAEAFGQEEDSQFFAGSGSPHTGIFSVTTGWGNEVSVSTSLSNVTAANLSSMVYGIKSSYTMGAAFYMHRTVYNVIANLVDSNNRPLIVNVGDPTRETLYGYPVRLIEAAPTNAGTGNKIIFGNLSNSVIGVKRELTVKVLYEATVDGVNLAENDLVGLRVTKRDAFNAGLVNAYSVLEVV